MSVASITRQVAQAITGGTTPGATAAPVAASPTRAKPNDGVLLTLSPEARAVTQKSERTAVLMGSPDTFAKIAPKGSRLNVRA